MSHSEHVQELNEASFDEATAEGLTLVDFWAPWCGPCRMQGPVPEALAVELADSLRVAKVNLDEAPGLAGRFAVQAIPLLVLLRDGREIARFVGLRSKAELADAIVRAA